MEGDPPAADTSMAHCHTNFGMATHWFKAWFALVLACGSLRAFPESFIVMDAAAVTAAEGEVVWLSGYYWTQHEDDPSSIEASVGSVSFDPTENTLTWSYAPLDGPAESQVVTVTMGTLAGTVSTTFQLWVNNVDPTLVTSGDTTATKNESTWFELGEFADPGEDAPWMVDVYWGDVPSIESFTVNSQGPLPDRAHTYTSTGSYTIQIVVHDKDGGFRASHYFVEVINPPPVLSPPESQSTEEGTEATFALGSFTDDFDTAWTVSVDWGDGDVDTYDVTTAGSLSGTHTYAQDGTYSVVVRVVDADGGVGIQTIFIVVDDVAVDLTLSETSVSATEGSAVTVDLGSFTDPGDDGPWLVEVYWGDSTSTSFSVNTPGSLGTLSHTYRESVIEAVDIFVTASSGASSDHEYVLVTVANVAPSFSGQEPRTTAEGSSDNIRLGAFSDPGEEANWTVTIDWGDDSTDSYTVSWTGTLGAAPHTYAASGTYTVSVTVDDGEDSSSTTFLVTVTNEAPSVTPGGDTTTGEGATTNFDLGSFTDAGLESSWTVTVNWGDGSADDTFSMTSADFLPLQTHTYEASSGTPYTVTVTVNDGEGGEGSGSFTVDVANVAPAVTSPANQDATEDEAQNIPLGSFTDPGLDAPWTITVDWGDGTTAESFTAATAGDLGTRSHAYATPGTFTVAVTVADEAESGATTFSAVVAAANDAPIAGADSVNRVSGRPLKVPAATPLANDTDEELDTLSITDGTGTSANGVTVRFAGGWVFYDATSESPNTTDTFTYSVSDGNGGIGTGTVTVNVTTPTATSPTRNLFTAVAAGPENRNITVTFQGVPRRDYQIWAQSTVGGAWTLLTGASPVTAANNGRFSILDANVANSTTRYYRTELVPATD